MNTDQFRQCRTLILQLGDAREHVDLHALADAIVTELTVSGEVEILCDLTARIAKSIPSSLHERHGILIPSSEPTEP